MAEPPEVHSQITAYAPIRGIQPARQPPRNKFPPSPDSLCLKDRALPCVTERPGDVPGAEEGTAEDPGDYQCMTLEGMLPKYLNKHPPRATDLTVISELLMGGIAEGSTVMGSLRIGLPVSGEDLCKVPRTLDQVEMSIEPGPSNSEFHGPKGRGGHAITRSLMYSSQCASRNPRIPRLGR